jgi:hypothetical protein
MTYKSGLEWGYDPLTYSILFKGRIALTDWEDAPEVLRDLCNSPQDHVAFLYNVASLFEGARLRREKKLAGILGGTTSEEDAAKAMLEAIEATAKESGEMTEWAGEIERLAHSLSVTEKDGWILLESERARQIAQALRDLVRDRIELEDEISIWRSFMVPEPVVRDVSREAERRMYMARIKELEAKVEELQWGT